MRRFSMAQEALWSDLKQRSVDAMFDAQFPENGAFVRRAAGARDYFYYVGYEKAAGTGGTGRQYSKYVGPADDPAVLAQVEAFGTIKASYRERREIVRALRGFGLSRPPAFVGEVVEALWKAGVFRLRCVLVGTAAFQTYEGLMGVRFPMAPTMTGDVDVAQFRPISVAVDDRTEPLLGALQRVDPSFAAVPHTSHPLRSVAFRNARGFRVEFLAPHIGAEELAREPFDLPAMDDAAGQPLRFLDYLIHKPERSIVLHGGGIPVLVPAPERFCVHKMIVSERRREGSSSDKARKDLQQASLLLEAYAEVKLLADLGHAWLEAWDRGPKWREALAKAELRLSPAAMHGLASAREIASTESDRDSATLSKQVASIASTQRRKLRSAKSNREG